MKLEDQKNNNSTLGKKKEKSQSKLVTQSV